MKLYKLTDEDDRTHGGCQWGENVTHETSGEGDLCGPGWTHWYTHPLLAVLLNPIHGNYDLKTAHLWEGEGRVGKKDRGLKVGCTKGTTIKRIPLPEISIEQKIRFALLCVMAVYDEPGWIAWANDWLSGKDRSIAAASAAWADEAAAWAARAAARAAWAADAAASAAWAAEATASAAWAAEATASAAWAAEAARAAARAAAWADEAASAAWADEAAAKCEQTFDLITLAKKTMEGKR